MANFSQQGQTHISGYHMVFKKLLPNVLKIVNKKTYSIIKDDYDTIY